MDDYLTTTRQNKKTKPEKFSGLAFAPPPTIGPSQPSLEYQQHENLPTRSSPGLKEVMNEKDATVVGFSDYALDGSALNDDEFAHLSLFHRAKQIGFDIVHNSSACHHSNLYPHQNAAVRAVIQLPKRPRSFRSYKKGVRQEAATHR